MLTFYHPDYAPHSMNVSTYLGQTLLTNITLIKLTHYQLDSMVGGTVTHYGHLIKIEGGIFTDQDGYLYNGSINVKVGYLDSKSIP
jgi:hypothetical protein